jgi:hypothetical protein
MLPEPEINHIKIIKLAKTNSQVIHPNIGENF